MDSAIVIVKFLIAPPDIYKYNWLFLYSESLDTFFWVDRAG